MRPKSPARQETVRESDDSVSDEVMVQQVARGERDAFAAFYDRHARYALGLLVRLVRERAAAEDLLQETFWQVWRSAARYDPARGSPQVWLAVIARSRARDYLRRQRTSTTMEAAGAPADGADPALQSQKRESANLAQRALAALPAEQQGPICLSFYGGLTHEEICTRTGVPLGTVKTRIRLGMQRLRELLSDDAPARHAI
ncbi:MAG: sigma-70 family RNA polymerase sigma factor [Phycisphaerae bacterium]